MGLEVQGDKSWQFSAHRSVGGVEAFVQWEEEENVG